MIGGLPGRRDAADPAPPRRGPRRLAVVRLLLAHRPGAHHVTSVEIDPIVADTARHALNRAGYGGITVVTAGEKSTNTIGPYELAGHRGAMLAIGLRVPHCRHQYFPYDGTGELWFLDPWSGSWASNFHFTPDWVFTVNTNQQNVDLDLMQCFIRSSRLACSRYCFHHRLPVETRSWLVFDGALLLLRLRSDHLIRKHVHAPRAELFQASAEFGMRR